MKSAIGCGLLLLWLVLCASSVAALEIADAVMTTDIRQRAPVDAINSVAAPADKLYCYTRVVGALEDTWISHVWYYEDQEVARVRLPVSSTNWRTWSSKRILPDWRGQWRVEVLDAADEPLLLVPFSIE
ncbi:MAG: DUF2914 domain-containing protein [Desulfuromonadaceae bacterium]|nr:DUF2914 domain-containing protein [Desulfuromonadaceae bacterium]